MAAIAFEAVNQLSDESYVEVLAHLYSELEPCVLSVSTALSSRLFSLSLPSLKRFGKKLNTRKLHKVSSDTALDDRLYYALFAAERYDDCINLIKKKVGLELSASNNQIKYLIWSFLCLGEHEQIEILALQHESQIKACGLDKHCQLSREIKNGGLGQVKDAYGNTLASFQLTSFNPSAMQTSLHHMSGMFSEIPELHQVMVFAKDKTVLDIGSLVGNHSVFFAKICGCRVTSVDSDPSCCAYTELNMLLNGISRDSFSVINAFAGKNNGGDSFIPSEDAPRKFSLRTEARRFDFIKIDVDGGELEFLEDSIIYIPDHRPILYCEISAQNLTRIAELFRPLGYSIRKMTSRSDFEGDNNYLLTP